MADIQEIVVISGKGGTGKTMMTASLVPYLENPVLADCDVDAPDLHILLKPANSKIEKYEGMEVGYIDPDLCIGCGKCREACRFDAIDESFTVLNHRCEGCGVCEFVCPQNAASMKNVQAGEIFQSQTNYGEFVHARLFPGEETSGRLVAEVRKKASALAKESDKKIVLTDGSPGIGCPVIASLTGATRVLIVTEPSVSGLHDLDRIVQLVRRLSIPMVVVINKTGLVPAMDAKVERYCRENRLEIGLWIPYAPEILDAVCKCKIPSEVNEDLFRDIGLPAFAESLH